MALSHEYAPLRENEEKDGEDIKFPEPPLKTTTPIITSWWKLLLFQLLAAGVGAGIMFLAVHAFDTTKSTSSPTTTAASVVTPTTVTVTATATDLATPTAAISKVQEDDSENPLAGQVLDCGHSPEEAREKGCVYDVMMQDWVPEPCYDAILTERYLAQGNWTWYRDGDGKETIPLEEMRLGEHGSAWMATSYHKAHCVFSWLKIIRALRNDAGISQELLSYDHVLHCAHGALNADSEDQGLGVRAPTNYAKCALYRDWKVDFVPDKHNSTQKL